MNNVGVIPTVSRVSHWLTPTQHLTHASEISHFAHGHVQYPGCGIWLCMILN